MPTIPTMHTKQYYFRDVDVLLGFNRQEGLMVTSLFKGKFKNHESPVQKS